jgi:hypothetical protein
MSKCDDAAQRRMLMLCGCVSVRSSERHVLGLLMLGCFISEGW